MKYQTENDVKKIRPLVRVMAGFILFCGVIAGTGLVFALMTEVFHVTMLLGFVVIGLMVHVTGSVALRGYAPKYLLFAHGPE